MDETPKIFSVSDLHDLNEFARQKTGVTVDSMREMAYRKGCHQTASRIYSAALGLKSRDEIISFLGSIEDVLQEIRQDGGPHHALLDEAIGAALSRKNNEHEKKRSNEN